ncbi:MAG: hypothetical protein H7Y31_04980 [Chitinophagaceae bacterium]|nr:hypothetical protein [Chitinophagaceae bacterium]
MAFFKPILITLGLASGLNYCLAQDVKFNQRNSAAQIGYTLKAQAELGTRKGNWFHWRIGASAGIGAFAGENWFYPSLQVDLMLYHGGMGSKWPGEKKNNYFDVEANVAYTITAGLESRMANGNAKGPAFRSYPLYYFNTFQLPPLQNPYNWSASIGGNIVWLTTRKKDKLQQVGFANLHFGRLQLNYANDGPFFPKPLGDRYDRLHTGTGFVTWHGDRHWNINLIEVGYEKFTGFSKNAYELANLLGTGYMYYRDTTQHFYNKSRVFVTVANPTKRWGGTVSAYNYSAIDVQHNIHLGAFYPLHMVPYKGHIGVSGNYYYGQTKIGLQ